MNAQVTITREILPDDMGDRPDTNDEFFWPSRDPKSAGYVLPGDFDVQQQLADARMRAWECGEWRYVGVRAKAEIKIPHGHDWIVSHISSPGLWGIESDSDESYLNEVYEEEKATLLGMLESLKAYEVMP